jgi:hypothetical protein
MEIAIIKVVLILEQSLAFASTASTEAMGNGTYGWHGYSQIHRQPFRTIDTALEGIATNDIYTRGLHEGKLPLDIFRRLRLGEWNLDAM